MAPKGEFPLCRNVLERLAEKLRAATEKMDKYKVPTRLDNMISSQKLFVTYLGFVNKQSHLQALHHLITTSPFLLQLKLSSCQLEFQLLDTLGTVLIHMGRRQAA